MDSLIALYRNLTVVERRTFIDRINNPCHNLPSDLFVEVILGDLCVLGNPGSGMETLQAIPLVCKSWLYLHDKLLKSYLKKKIKIDSGMKISSWLSYRQSMFHIGIPKQNLVFQDHCSTITSIAFAWGYLITAAHDHLLIFYRKENNKFIRFFSMQGPPCTFLKCIESKGILLCGSLAGDIWSWKMRFSKDSGVICGRFQRAGHPSAVTCAYIKSYENDTASIVMFSGGGDGSLCKWTIDADDGSLALVSSLSNVFTWIKFIHGGFDSFGLLVGTMDGIYIVRDDDLSAKSISKIETIADSTFYSCQSIDEKNPALLIMHTSKAVYLAKIKCNGNQIISIIDSISSMYISGICISGEKDFILVNYRDKPTKCFRIYANCRFGKNSSEIHFNHASKTLTCMNVCYPFDCLYLGYSDGTLAILQF